MSAALLDRLIEQLHARGLRVEPGAKPGELRLAGNTKDADESVMKALRVFKAQLLERFGSAPRPEPEPPAPAAHEIFQARVAVEAETVTCELCERDMTDPVDRAAVATNPLLCDRGGARVQRNKYTGEVTAPAIPRCPFKGGNP